MKEYIPFKVVLSDVNLRPYTTGVPLASRQGVLVAVAADDSVQPDAAVAVEYGAGGEAHVVRRCRLNTSG